MERSALAETGRPPRPRHAPLATGLIPVGPPQVTRRQNSRSFSTRDRGGFAGNQCRIDRAD